MARRVNNGTAVDWLVAKASFGLLGALRVLPLDLSVRGIIKIARWMGPKLKRHRLVVYNLRQAFPEKTAPEIEALALKTWEQLGRMLSEYIFFHKLYDFDPAHPHQGRVTLRDESGVIADLKARPRAHIFVTAHTGNFELLPHVATAMGVPIAVLYRPPNNPYIAEEINRFRGGSTDWLIPSFGGASAALARHLSEGRGLGILVDQKFRKGVESSFFGRPVKTNPLVPRLARQFDCDVIPARCIRLEGNRFEIEVLPPLALPRDEAGLIDPDRAVQVLNDQVEAWVREFPEQWLWYHDRWHQKGVIDLPDEQD